MVSGTIQGQITFRRAVSKKLVFYDLLCCQDNVPYAAQPAGGQWLEIVVKAGVFGTVQEVKDIRDRLKLGDVIAVEGCYENQHTLQAAKVTVLNSWRDTSPGVAFKPCPSPSNPKAGPGALSATKEGDSGTPGQQAQARQQQQLQEHQTGTLPIIAHQEAAPSAAHNTTAGSGSLGSALSEPESQQPQLKKPQLAVCKFWVNSGQCAKGSACPYAHLQSSALRPTRSSWLKDRQERRQVLSSSLGYCHNESAAAKGRRAQLFAAWLVEKYGRDVLSEGAGVLDVAGGAGGMTIELSVVHGVKCTLVDPRVLKLNKQQHKQLRQLGKTALLTTWTAEQLQEQQEVQALEGIADKQDDWQKLQLQGTATQIHPVPRQQTSVQDTMTDRQQQHPLQDSSRQQTASLDAVQDLEPGLQREPNDSSSGAIVQFHQVQGWFGPELWRSSGWRQLLSDCSLVIGLHPDQATEPILDYAVECSKPFAVVPCCVFPRLFPDRHLVRGSATVPVVTYADLVEYLVTKAGAQQQVLPFEGANLVVYRQ